MKYFQLILFLLLCTKLFSQDLSDGLLLDYPFNNNFNDVSGNDFHGINFGAIFTEDRNGNTNSAIYFDGTDDYINFPNLAQLKPNLPVSFSFWIRYDSNNADDRDLFNTSFEEDRNTGVFFNSQQSTGFYAVNYGDGSYSYLSNTRRTYVTNVTIETNVWHHVVAVVSSQNDMKIYIDCIDNGGSYSGTGGTLEYSNFPGSLGRHDRDLNSPANYFRGAIDDFRYWDRELTDEDVAELLGISYNIASTNPTSCGSEDGEIVISGLLHNTIYTINYNYEGTPIVLTTTSDSTGSIIISGLSSGNYTTIVVTQVGTVCGDDLGDLELMAQPLMAIISYTDPTSCGLEDGEIIISGLHPNTTYSINYNYEGTPIVLTTDSDNTGSIIISGLSSGNYTTIVITQDLIGCTDNLGDLELMAQPLMAIISYTDPTSCGSEDGEIVISGLLPNTTYSINYNYEGIPIVLTTTSDGTGSIIISGLSSGNYTTIVVTQDVIGCTDNLADLELIGRLITTISFTNLTSCESSDGTITISGLVSGNNYTVTYVYNSVTETLTITADISGTYVITGLESGIYSSIVVTEDITGCDDDLGQIELDCFNNLPCFRTRLFFTPNGDGINDYWSLNMSPNACDYILYIYDRYGKILKILSPEDNKWDGTYNGYNLPSSDYWYSVEYIKDNERLTYKSHFALKR